MSDAPVVCTACGNANDAGAQMVADFAECAEQNAALRDALARAEVRVRALRGEQMRRVQQDKRYPDAMRVLEHWKARCMPTARELAGKRVEHAIARLKGGYSVEDLCRAVDGYAAFPYGSPTGRKSNGTRDNWQADAELILRTPEHVDRGLRMAESAEESGAVFQPLTEPEPVASSSNGRVHLGAIGLKAVSYARRGWPVFPCVPDGKPPATIHGLLDANTDLKRIAAYWGRVPDANVAVRTGAESGIVVLDVDGAIGYESLLDLVKRGADIPATLSCVTPRGGQHLYFRHPGVEIRNTQGVPGPGLDVRGDGGYVLAPPSRVDGKGYEPDDQVPIADMPAWLVNGLVGRQVKVGGRVDPAEWEGMVSRGVKEGERNGQLTRLAGMLLNKHTPGFVLGMLLTVNAQRCKPPLPEREVHRIVESLQRKRARVKS